MNGEVALEKYSEVIGLPVICAKDGRKLGTVKDVIFCPGARSVKAFLLERKSYEIGKRVVFFEKVLSLGRDAVIVDDCSCVTALKKGEYAAQFKDQGRITGLRVYSKKGEDFGIVKDVLFDHRTGAIEGVEVSDGLLQDIYRGRNILPLFGKVEFSEDNILVGEESVEEMMNTGGGIRRKLLEG